MDFCSYFKQAIPDDFFTMIAGLPADLNP